MTSFDLFRNSVLKMYQEKKSQDLLDSWLSNHSPANLKKYCLVRLNEGLNVDDTKVFERVFVSNGNVDDLERTINRTESEKLKTLQYFIIGRTKTTDENLVKLLAVLIDFQPRPFRLNDWSKKEEGGTILCDYPPDQEAKSNNQPQKNNDVLIVNDFKDKFYKRKKSVVYAIGAAALGLGICFRIIDWQAEQCMLWQDEQYIAVHCKDNYPNTIALNPGVLHTFRKITRPDTLTIRHEKRVWYSKIDNHVEFFTTIGHGFHPEFMDRSLKAATKEILEKYAGKSMKGNGEDIPTNEK